MISEKYRKEFAGKKVTVMGLGLLGRGVGDALFLAECGAELIVTDLKTKEQLAESVAQFAELSNVTFVLGEHRLEDFEGRDFILKAAGVPFDSVYIAHAKDKSVPVEMSASLFAKLSGVPMIAVTGTRGKSTVTHMIHHVLSTVTEGGTIILGGNVRGISNLQLLKEVPEDGNAFAVFELDSWQLQGFGDAKISPHIAVFATFMDDHLNYYKNDRDAYFADKANIFRYQDDHDVLVTTREVFQRAQEFAKGKDINISGEVILTDASILPEDMLLSMPGEHNRLNAALAYEALKAVSLEDEEIFEGLASFRGVPGRLEYLGATEKGARIYNDNNATTPDATIAGIKAVVKDNGTSGTSARVILIAGGADKDISLTKLGATINTDVSDVLLLAGTGTNKLLPQLSVQTSVFDSLEVAVTEAVARASMGDVILFSPAFASFGMFINEYDRNDQFVAFVKKYVE